ncbi:MAG: acyltransferase family protein [Bryobacteraceae bacterium]|nr:acyltransferase family protein [Bryobacteraceae bacterium]
MHHISLTYGLFRLGAGWPFKDPYTHPGFDFVTVAIHIFRMPTFFVVARFFSHLLVARNGMQGMLVNRVRRVLLPLVVLAIPLGLTTWAAMEWGKYRFTGGAGRAISSGLLDLSPFQPFLLNHLWFLYYLLIFYAILALVWELGRVLPLANAYETALRVSGNAVGHPGSVLLLAALSFGVLLTMPSRTLETFVVLWPLHWNSLGGYFTFFGFGWILFHKREALSGFARFGTVYCLLAIVTVAVNYFSVLKTGNALAAQNFLRAEQWRLVTAVTGALGAALLVYGLIGFFVRHFEKHRRVVRYLADSCYWLYLTHLPLVIVLSVWMMPWNAPAIVKVTINLAVSVTLLLVSYEYFVRNTVIGMFLNGRRLQPGLPHESIAGSEVKVPENASPDLAWGRDAISRRSLGSGPNAES